MQDALGDVDNDAAGLGDVRYALAVAHQDFYAEFFLEQTDLLADARLRRMKRLGRSR